MKKLFLMISLISIDLFASEKPALNFVAVCKVPRIVDFTSFTKEYIKNCTFNYLKKIEDLTTEYQNDSKLNDGIMPSSSNAKKIVTSYKNHLDKIKDKTDYYQQAIKLSLSRYWGKPEGNSIYYLEDTIPEVLSCNQHEVKILAATDAQAWVDLLQEKHLRWVYKHALQKDYSIDQEWPEDQANSSPRKIAQEVKNSELDHWNRCP